MRPVETRVRRRKASPWESITFHWNRPHIRATDVRPACPWTVRPRRRMPPSPKTWVSRRENLANWRLVIGIWLLEWCFATPILATRSRWTL